MELTEAGGSSGSSKPPQLEEPRQRLRATTTGSFDASPSSSKGASSATGEVTGEFKNFYQKTIAERDTQEDQVSAFLERDGTFPPSDWDPNQVAADHCTVLKDLVAERARKFRRPVDVLIDTTSSLPFGHEGKAADLAELADLLALDLERRSEVVKCTEKRPGFISLQVSARVPVVARDPAEDLELRSGLVGGVQMLRLDLRPGEVRQLRYALDSPEFRHSDVARRMAALVDPERSVLARLVTQMRAKEQEAQALAAVMADILRDLGPSELPTEEEPVVPTDSLGEAKERARLEQLLLMPRRSLSRLLKTMDGLASCVAPLIPSVAKSLDRVALVCVREIDRLAAHCHKELERLRRLWAEAEVQRRAMTSEIDRMGGKTGGQGGIELGNRVAALTRDLNRQDKMYSDLLTERDDVTSQLEDSRRMEASLRKRVKNLEAQVQALQQKGARAAVAAPQPAAVRAQAREVLPRAAAETDTAPPPESRFSESQTVHTRRSVSKESRRSFSKESFSCEILQRNTSAEALPNPDSLAEDVESPPRPGPSKVVRGPQGKSATEPLLSFSTHVASQTETDHIFSHAENPAEELSYEEVHELVRIAGRIYGNLSRYEWNMQAHSYLWRGAESSSDEDTGPALHLLERRAQPEKTVAEKASERKARRLAMLGKLRVQVERAHQHAYLQQLESSGAQLRQCCQSGFQEWAEQQCREASKKAGGKGPLTAEDIWAGFQELVHTESMRARIRSLEDHLNSLLPIAERARGSDGQHSDMAFWKRATNLARQMTINDKKPQSLSHSKSMRRRSSLGSLADVHAFELPRLLQELALIWATVGATRDTKNRARNVHEKKLPAQQVLQASIKTFYLRKSGRSKLVEAAVVLLCRSVLDSVKDHKVGIFAIMAEIQPAAAMVERMPKMRRFLVGGERSADESPRSSPPAQAFALTASTSPPQQRAEEVLDIRHLNELPLDGPLCMAQLMFSLKSISRSRRYPTFYGEPEDAHVASDSDASLPLQLVLTSMWTVVHARSRTTALFVNLVLYAYLDFKDHEEAPSRRTSPVPTLPVVTGTSPDLAAIVDGERSDSSEGPESVQEALLSLAFTPEVQPKPSAARLAGADAQALQETVYVSSLIGCWLWHQAQQQGDVTEHEEVATAQSLWARCLEDFQSTNRSHMGMRASLNMGLSKDCNAEQVAEFLVEADIVCLPTAVVERAIVRIAGCGEEKTSAVNITEDIFLHLCWFWHKAPVRVRCRESLVLWACLWALGNERKHEMALMGQLFQLYDSSEDGWLQFEEFFDFIQALAPEVPKSDAEELFMGGAEEATGDMTKEVFLNLVLKLGISSDVDQLEELVVSKRQAMYGMF